MARRQDRAVVRVIKEHIKRPVHGCEVGVWQGKLSAELLKAFDTLKLVMVDRWEVLPDAEKERDPRMGRQDEMDMMNAFISARDNTKGFNRTIVVADAMQAAAMMSHHLFDFVYIDACHEYHAVRNDLMAWHPRVRPGGLLCGDDYGFEAFAERIGRTGVKCAVDEWAAAAEKEIHHEEKNFWWTVV